MLINLQFPIIDLRAFSNVHHRLPFPNWPSPTINQFVRSFGRIGYRGLGGIPELGESKVCFARKAIRFEPNFNSHFFGNDSYDNSPNRILLKYRRYHFDGIVAGKLDIGFVTKGFFRNIQPQLDILQLINCFLELYIKVHMSQRNPIESKLYELYSLLPKQLFQCTTAFADLDDLKKSSPFIMSGTPLILIDFTYKDVLPILPKIREVYVSNLHAVCYQMFYPYKGMDYSIVLLKALDAARIEQIRYFRLYLTSIHYLKEALLKVLSATLNGKINPAITEERLNLYQNFLNENMKFIKRKSSEIGNELLNLAFATSELLEPGEIDDLLKLLKNVICLRPNIFNNVSRIINFIELANNNFELVFDKHVYKAQLHLVHSSKNKVERNDIDMAYNDFINHVDYMQLSKELQKLKDHLISSCPNGVSKRDVDFLDKASISAKTKNKRKTIEFLSKVGENIFEIAKAIGVEVAASAIKGRMF